MFAWLFSLSVFVLVCFWFRDLPFQIINSMFWITLPPFPILTLFFNSLIRFVHHQFSRVQSLSCVQFFVTPWSAARQATLSITNSKSLLKLMSMELVMPSNHLILCHSLLLPSVFPSIRGFSNGQFPEQGSNPATLCWEHGDLNLWSTGEVPVGYTL